MARGYDGSSHVGDVVLGDAHRAAVSALEDEIESQRVEIDRLHSVVDEVSDVKETARLLLRQFKEQKGENDRLSSELDRVNGELVESLEESNEWQDKYDSLKDQLEVEKGINKNKSRIIELGRAEASGGEELARLKNEVAEERKLRHAAEEGARERDRELERRNARAEELRAQNEKLQIELRAENEKLKGELERSTSEVAQLRKLRAESMRGKSQLEYELNQRDSEVQEYEERNTKLEEANSQLADRSKELQMEVERANTLAEECKSSANGEMELNRTLQSDLEEVTLERDELKRKFDQLSQDLDAASQSKDGEIQQLHDEVEGYKATITEETKKTRELHSILEQVTSEVETERRSKEEAAREKVELEGKIDELKSKINCLNEDMAAARENATLAMEKKDGESQQLNSQIEEYKKVAETEAEKSRELQSGLERANALAEERKSSRDSEMESNKKLRSDLEQMTNERDRKNDSLMQLNSEIEEYKLVAGKDAKKIEELQSEVERANALAEECKSATDGGRELNEKLLSDLQRMTSERDQSLACSSGWKRKLAEETERIEELQAAAQEKDDELLRLRDHLGECKLVTANEEESRRALQLDLELMTTERDEALQKLSATENEAEVKKRLKLQLDQVIGERDEALRCNSELENKVAKLNRDTIRFVEKANEVMKEKDEKLQRLSVRLEELKAAPYIQAKNRVEGASNREGGVLSKGSADDGSGHGCDGQDPAPSPVDGGNSRHGEHASADAILQLATQLEQDGDASLSGRSRGTARGGRIGSIFSRFGSQRNAAESDATSRDDRTTNEVPEAVVLSDVQMTRPEQDGDASLSGRSRGTRRGGRIGSIFSRFGSQRSAAEWDAASQDDRTRNEVPESVVSSNVQTIRQIKSLIEDLTVPNEEGSANVAELKTALSSFGAEENGSSAVVSTLRTAANDLESTALRDELARLRRMMNDAETRSLSMMKDLESTISLQGTQIQTLKDELARLRQTAEDVEALEATVRDLESTVSLQGTQNQTLKEELATLRNTIDDMGAHNSSQEDDVEHLRARASNLELRCKIEEDERRTMEEALRAQVECRDLIISSLIPSGTKDGGGESSPRDPDRPDRSSPQGTPDGPIDEE